MPPSPPRDTSGVIARGCAFRLASGRALYYDPSATFPAAWLAAGSDVVVLQKRRYDGVLYFMVRPTADDVTPTPSGATRSFWFAATDAEAAACR